MNVLPIELKSRLDRGENFRLVDVREVEEWEIVRLPGATLIPLSEFEQRATAELSPNETIILYCHHGIRSARAQAFLQAQGYGKVVNLTGGIDGWAMQVEPTMQRY